MDFKYTFALLVIVLNNQKTLTFTVNRETAQDSLNNSESLQPENKEDKIILQPLNVKPELENVESEDDRTKRSPQLLQNGVAAIAYEAGRRDGIRDAIEIERELEYFDRRRPYGGGGFGPGYDRGFYGGGGYYDRPLYGGGRYGYGDRYYGGRRGHYRRRY